MDLPEVPIQRTVARVYGRRRTRARQGQEDQIRPGSSTGQGAGTARGKASGQGDDGRAQLLPSKPPSKRNTEGSSPSTPPRKRRSLSRTPSASSTPSPYCSTPSRALPAKSSPGSSSPSKRSPCKPSPSSSPLVSIDGDIDRIFSPLRKPRRAKEEETSESEDGEEKPLTQSYAPLRLAKTSFANRMAPRRQKGAPTTTLDPSAASQSCTAPLLAAVEVTSKSSVVGRDIREEKGPTLAAAPALSTTHRQRYERVQVCSLEEDLPARRCIAESLEAPKASLDALSQRWAELDDLDDGDEEPAIRSITGLRSSGQNRQFQEDFQYLVLDLSAAQSLALRRSTCVEIVKKVMSVDEEESEGEENGSNGATGLAPPKLSLLSPFLRQIKTADLARTLWLQLRQAEAGSGKDEVLDLALALICAKIVHCDKGLALVLCKETDFSTCMACLMGTTSGRVTLQDKTGLKCLETLKEFVRSGTRARATEGPLIAAVILEVVSALADLPDLSLRIGRVGPDVTSIASQMWCLISAQAQLTASHSVCDSMEVLDHHSLDLIAQTFVNCASQVGSADDPHPVTSPTDLITLLRWYARSCDQRSEERQLEPVCSLLRMTIALAASERCNWVAGLVNTEGTVEVLLHLASQSASMVASKTCEESQSGGLDLLTLALALLTDLLVKEPGRVRSLVLAASVPTKPVLLLAQVLQQQRRKEALDAGAGYLAGSLAVVLTLLVVGKEAEGGKAVQTEVMAQLKAGLQSDSVRTGLGILVVTLDEFAAMMQVVSKTFHRLGRASAHADEAAEDEGFFARLSSALALLLSTVDG